MSYHEAPKSSEAKEGYKNVVEQIKELNWESLEGPELQQLMQLSYASALEFAEALRIALTLYPDDENLKQTAAGELNATNLSFEDYTGPGDHAAFLEHFLKKEGIASDATLDSCADTYKEACRLLDDRTRAMSIFSREEELSGIFEQILKAKDWSMPGLPAFRYYLAMHIRLDSDPGGHHDLTKTFPVTNEVKPFYEARLQMYRAIPELFEK